MEKTNLLNFTFDRLSEYVREELGEKPFRARQLFEWLYRNGAENFEDMTNLSREFRKRLSECCTIEPIALTDAVHSKDGATKLQFTLEDGAAVESVLIPGDDRLTLCMSSQVGCAMGCAFCFTGSLKLQRNLSSAEIVDQYRQALKYTGGGGDRISNIVMMGMGEPLHNLENVIDAVNILMDERSYNLSSRRVTVSTCGLAPEIRTLAERTNACIALSLNATTDEVRSGIMPVNRRYPIAELLGALESYPKPRRKRIVLEYVMLKGVNDSPYDAKRLTRIARRLGCKINLIPYNPHEAGRFERPSDETVLAFQKILIGGGVNTFIRRSRGLDIFGACGMLGKRKK